MRKNDSACERRRQISCVGVKIDAVFVRICRNCFAIDELCNVGFATNCTSFLLSFQFFSKFFWGNLTCHWHASLETRFSPIRTRKKKLSKGVLRHERRAVVERCSGKFSKKVSNWLRESKLDGSVACDSSNSPGLQAPKRVAAFEWLMNFRYANVCNEFLGCIPRSWQQFASLAMGHWGWLINPFSAFSFALVEASRQLDWFALPFAHAFPSSHDISTLHPSCCLLFHTWSLVHIFRWSLCIVN